MLYWMGTYPVDHFGLIKYKKPITTGHQDCSEGKLEELEEIKSEGIY